MTPDERFDSKWVTAGGCHLWVACTSNGYGTFKTDGKMVYAHRWAYQRKYGMVAPGMVLDHYVCDNRLCCNPDHVRPVTHRENLLRGNGLTALNAAKTHCPKGHEYTESNTRNREGKRECRICLKIRRRK